MILFQKEWSSLKKLMYLAGSALAEGWRIVTGAIASFVATKVTALPMEFDLVPIQDLHGQANPYPAGGGSNLAEPQVPSSNQYYDYANDNGVYSIKRKADTSINPRQYFTASFADIGLADGETYTAYCFEDEQYTYKCGLYNGSGGMAVLDIHTTAYTFTYRASTMSAYRLGVWSNSPNTLPLNTTITFHAMLVKGSTTPSSFAPYSNICPITGHDGFTRTGTGKNLFDGEVYNMAFVAKASPSTAADIQGNASWRSIYARVEGGKTYTISRTTIETNRFRMVATVDEPKIGDDAVILNNSASNDSLYAVTVTIPDGYNYLFVYLSNQGTTVTPDNYQIELGSHATTIVPYQGQSYSTTFPTPPGTVYGGHVTDNGDGTGTLTVTDKYYVFDGDEGWFIAATGTNRVFRFNEAFPDYIKASTLSPYISNWAIPTTVINNVENGGFTQWVYRTTATSTNKNLLVVTPTSDVNMTLDSFKAMLEETPLEICAKLFTPVSYTLPLDIIQSLIGQNHIWVDNADSVSVEYWGH